ncbi:uncharacterized protein LOC115670651 isoform X1 [Syzygium oleosum]|uniref:uncharacterized protein LOC115670651 isoform X1 n=2 Tax=Syzygium oleosum TaxID=219896 RepID=UPI0011D1E204|nr:uncharacterized protein LOC115670651 isoform X1 [Syzygium oleosum]
MQSISPMLCSSWIITSLLPPAKVFSVNHEVHPFSDRISGYPELNSYVGSLRCSFGNRARHLLDAPQQQHHSHGARACPLLNFRSFPRPLGSGRSMAASVSALSFSVHWSRLARPLRARVNVDPCDPRRRFSSFPFGSKPNSSVAFVGPRHLSPVFADPRASPSPAKKALSGDGFASAAEGEGDLTIPEERPLKFLLRVVFWASLSLAWFAASKDANAAVDSIKASGFGLKIASRLRSSGWPDEAVVFALATLPVIELRGAIPVGYWMQLKPSLLTVLSVLGNMVPVPFIILYLKKFATFLAGRNRSASRLLEMLFERAKKKAGPVEEFQWLGLMLFVAVPFPGTGAWTGAIIASVLDMPFWPAMTANFCGVVLAGLLVNLLVNLGLKYAVVTGIILFFISTFMWSILRSLRKSLSSSN